MVNAICSMHLMLSIKKSHPVLTREADCAVCIVYGVLQQFNVTKLNGFPCIYLKYAQKMSFLGGQLVLRRRNTGGILRNIRLVYISTSHNVQHVKLFNFASHIQNDMGRHPTPNLLFFLIMLYVCNMVVSGQR